VLLPLLYPTRLPRAEHHQGNDHKPELHNQNHLPHAFNDNLWQLANILLAAELMVKLKDPLIKLTHLARIFRLEIETPPWQPQ
jgi:hypothetical protein